MTLRILKQTDQFKLIGISLRHVESITQVGTHAYDIKCFGNPAVKHDKVLSIEWESDHG